MPLEVTVELGRTHKSINDILDFSPGTIIELDKIAGEPIDVLVNGKVVYSRGVSDAVKSNWVEFPLEPPADGSKMFRVVVRVTELTPVTDHTSWVFVGPLYVY